MASMAESFQGLARCVSPRFQFVSLKVFPCKSGSFSVTNWLEAANGWLVHAARIYQIKPEILGAAETTPPTCLEPLERGTLSVECKTEQACLTLAFDYRATTSTGFN